MRYSNWDRRSWKRLGLDTVHGNCNLDGPASESSIVRVRFHLLITMNDLLSRSLNRVRDDEDAHRDGHEDLETGKYPNVLTTNLKTNPEGIMAEFFKNIEMVKGEVNKVKQLLLKLKSANEESKGIHRADALKALRARMDIDIASVTNSATLINAKLVELDNSNLAHRRVPGCGAGTASDRQRVMLTENQRKKLKELMDEFQALCGKMVDEYKDTIARRYNNLTGKQADEETIETLIGTGESDMSLQQAIREQGLLPVLEVIREIQERHDGVKEMEKHLLELHSIFMDMSVLVDAQGQMINDIEANVTRATSYTRDGTNYLKDARRFQLSKRNVSVSLLTIVLLLLVLILVILKASHTI